MEFLTGVRGHDSLARWILGLGLALGGVLLMAAAGGDGVLDASWTATTTNSDGSPLTNLAFYRLYYGASNPPCPGPSFFHVASPTPSPASTETVTSRLTGLLAGNLYYVSVTAVNTSGNESRSEEHTSELQSLAYLVCRLLLEKKKKTNSYDVLRR